MKFFSDLFSCIIFAVLSGAIFTIIFKGLNQSILQLFVPIQKIMVNVKKRWLFRVIFFLTSILLCVVIKELFNLNNIGFGIAIGFSNSLIDIIFGTSNGANKSNVSGKIHQ